MSIPQCFRNIQFAQQAGGTCWFHSIVNGFLVTPRGRRLLNKAYYLYITTNRNAQPKYNYLTSCPRRGTIDLNSFWTYILYRLGKFRLLPNEVNNSEFQAIRNFRRNRRVNGGTEADVVRLCQVVFGSVKLPNNRQNMGINRPTVVNRTRIGPRSPVYIDYAEDPEYITLHPNGLPDYILNHIYISIDSGNMSGSGHAITAFKCTTCSRTRSNGTRRRVSCNNQRSHKQKTVRYIYDSNSLLPVKLDWMNKNEILRYARLNYPEIRIPDITYIGVYIKKEI
jgi:hypothetical protein